MSVDEFAQENRDRASKGLRLVDVSIDDGDFAAVWRPAAGAWKWASRTVGVFETADTAAFASGFRLDVLEVFDGSAGGGGSFWDNWWPWGGGPHGVPGGPERPGM